MADLDSNAAVSLSPTRTGADSCSSDAPVKASISDSFNGNTHSRQRPPRSLPPWIDSYEERYGPASEEQLRLLQPPTRIVRHQSNAVPDEPQRRVSRDGFVGCDDPSLGPAQTAQSRLPHLLRYGRGSVRGRKWDHLRSAEPVIVSKYKPVAQQGVMSWRDFINSSSWGRRANEESRIVEYQTLEKLQPTFNQDMKVRFHHTDGRAKGRRKTIALTKRIANGTMRHPLSPLLFRLGVMVTSLLALGIAARIYSLENNLQHVSAERTQSVVAIVVDCVAVPYIGYMIWDEYTGKPLGLRSAMSKMSLILLDLFFIIFKSASTALAFESFIYQSSKQTPLVRLSIALASFQLLGLISWSMTFTVNIFRTVKLLGGGAENKDESKV